MAIVLAAGFLGVWVFTFLHLPVPWLLGPLFSVLISQFFIKTHLYWPVRLRNIGLMIVGISIGQSFQLQVFSGMGWLIGIMLLINTTVFLFSVFLAFGLMKAGNVSLKTAMTCTVPGGLSQIVAFAEEEEGIDLGIVTYFHVVRVISIVIEIPLLLHVHGMAEKDELALSFSSLEAFIPLLIASAGAAWLGKKLKFPVPYFLSPMILVLLLQLFNFEAPEVPNALLNLAQLMIGAYIGQLLTPKMLKLEKKIIFLGVATAVLLLLFTIGQGWVMKEMMGYSLATSLLSTAAGGLDQMSLLASAIGADVTVVTVFQMFRILFIFLVVLPLLKAFCLYLDKRDAKS